MSRGGCASASGRVVLVDPESIDSRLERLSELLAESERIRAGGRAAYDATFRDRLAAQHLGARLSGCDTRQT